MTTNRRRNARHAPGAETTELTPLLPTNVPGGKSMCLCGHRGGGWNSEHAGFLGHGHCTAAGCTCPKFSWRRFLGDRPE